MRTHFCLQLLLGSTLALLLAACGDPLSGGGGNGGGGNGAGGNGGGGTTPAPEITFGQDVDVAPQVAAAGGEMTVSFKATADWTAGVTETKAIDWITVQPTGGKAGDVKVTITVKPNEGSEKRAASVVLKSGDVQKTISVTQEPKSNVLAEEDWYSVNYWERSDRQKMGLRGPVKKLDNLEFDQAGHLLYARAELDNPNFGDWLDKYYYDGKGRLVRHEYGRTTSKGGFEFDPWVVLEVTEYEYENPGKYVWVRPDNDFDSRKFVNFLGPEYRQSVNSLIKDLSAMRTWTWWLGSSDTKNCVDYTYTFSGDRLTVSVDQYARAYDYENDKDGGVLKEGNNDSYRGVVAEIAYKGNYPYSGSVYGEETVTSMTWQDNGMPLRVEGKGGITEYGTDKRYINPLKWTCMEGNPIDALFGFTFWREWSYDGNGELLQLLEGENLSSDRPWTRPTTYEYKLDSYGNWISFDQKYMILAEGPDAPVQSASLSRTIEYF